MSSDLLEKERLFFEAHRDEWLTQHPGKVALIKGEHLVGVFDSDENAYDAGMVQFGATPFMIRTIQEHDPVVHVPAYRVGWSRAGLRD